MDPICPAGPRERVTSRPFAHMALLYIDTIILLLCDAEEHGLFLSAVVMWYPDSASLLKRQRPFLKETAYLS